MVTGYHIKICDLGFARYVDIRKRYVSGSTIEKNFKWSAIETFTMNEYSSKSDVWSFGVVCWEIFSLGDDPHGKLNKNDFKRFVISGFKLRRPELCDVEEYRNIEQCWNIEPDDRPDFVQLVETFRRLLENAEEEERYPEAETGKQVMDQWHTMHQENR